MRYVCLVVLEEILELLFQLLKCMNVNCNISIFLNVLKCREKHL